MRAGGANRPANASTTMMTPSTSRLSLKTPRRNGVAVDAGEQVRASSASSAWTRSLDPAKRQRKRQSTEAWPRPIGST